MTTVFDLSGILVLPFWALAIVFPSWRWTDRLMRSPLLSAAPALLYAALVLPRLSTVLPVVLNPSLDAVARLLATPEGATIAWAHFLSFDLFVGRWIYTDARDRRISPVVVSPILFLTLMLGPLGWLVYVALRHVLATAAGRTSQIHRLIRAAWSSNRPLTALGLSMLVLLAISIVGLMVDPRIITGAPAWMKPAKFSASIVVYAFTLIWLLGYVRGRDRLVSWVSRITTAALGVEMVSIVTQVVRGTSSHFNVATPLDTALWVAMSVAIVPIWLMGMLVAALLVRTGGMDRAFAWSLRFGMSIAVVGMGLAFLMTNPTPTQQQSIASGRSVTAMGAHTVGEADGGPGLPIVGWSTVAGDLRVAHFLGLHAMQVLPIVGWLIGRLHARLSARRRVALVAIAGLAYLALVLGTAWQALRGQPVLSPDALTMAALLTVVGAAVGATAVVTLPRRRDAVLLAN